MKNSAYMDYSTPHTITESGAQAFRLGISKDECPVDPRSNANGVCWWNNGWETESKKTCKGPKCSAKRGVGHSIECEKKHDENYDEGPEIFEGTRKSLDKLKI